MINLPNNILFDTTYLPTWRNLLKFEIKAFLGNVFLNKTYTPSITPCYINIGCGNHIQEGWCNVDFYKMKFWKQSPYLWMQDLRRPLRCDCEIFDGAFCEHTLEHLHPTQALNLLKEIYRILRPNSILRVTVPDFKKYSDWYNNQLKDNQAFIQNNPHPLIAIRNLTQNYFHMSLYDFSLLQIFLEEAGFQSIKEYSFQKGQNPDLIIDSSHRNFETLYIEGLKR